MNLERPHLTREGVRYDKTTRTDLFLVTLEKSEKHYSPTTLYRDYAISQTRFHWESQSGTPSKSPTGQRYIHHRERGTHILLFVRARTDDPFTLLGPLHYVSHERDKPIAIVWELARQIPADLYAQACLAAG